MYLATSKNAHFRPNRGEGRRLRTWEQLARHNFADLVRPNRLMSVLLRSILIV